MSNQPVSPALDLSRQATAWQGVLRLMAQVVSQLERRFQGRYGACPQEAVSSAVRILLRHIDAGRVAFSDSDQVFYWLLTTATRKLRDRLEKEHLLRRQDLPADWGDEDAVEASCADTLRRFDDFLAGLTAEQRAVLDGRQDGKTIPAIAEENGWTVNRVETLLKQIKRRAERHLGGTTT